MAAVLVGLPLLARRALAQDCERAGANLIVRKDKSLAGATVDVYPVVRDAPAAGAPSVDKAGSIAPMVLEEALTLPPGTYELRAAFVLAPSDGSPATAAQRVTVPFAIAVTPRAAAAPEGAVTIEAGALAPVIADLALAAPNELTSAQLSIASAYAGVCIAPADDARAAASWEVGERCANLAYIQRRTWATERAQLERSCAGCPELAIKEKTWLQEQQRSLAIGCRLHSPRACAAWDDASEAELDRACRAQKDTSWAACLRLFARDERPLFYDARYEPPPARRDAPAVSEADAFLRAAIGLSVWRSPKREHPWVVLPFAVRISILASTAIGGLGVTGTLGLVVQHIPVLEQRGDGVAGSYQLVGLHTELGPSWSPFSFVRIDGGAFGEPSFNQSASTIGLKGELALILGDHELSAMVGWARMPNLTEGADGATRSSIGGADLPFFGLSYFYVVNER